MRYVVVGSHQSKSRPFSSLIQNLARRSPLFISLFLALASASITGCNPGSGPFSTSDKTDSNNVPPGSLHYTTNPVRYPYGSAIAPNALSSSGSIDSLSISPTLPAGLVFNTSNGTISGTPTTITPTQNYTVRASNAHGTSYVTISLTITDKPPTMTYGGLTTQIFTVGTHITTITPTLGGGPPTSCSASPPLPAGLTLSTSCVIDGTPTTPAAATNYIITASNSGGSAALAFNFQVKDIPPNIGFTPSSFTFYRGQAITPFQPSNSGGAITSCSSSPTLPAGLSLSSTCRISGTPTALAASTSYTITATNSGGSSPSTIVFTVQEAAPNILFIPAFVALTLNQASTVAITNSGGTPSLCSTSSPFPAGLGFAADCSIVGTPTSLQSGWVSTITASNSTGASSTTITIDVNDVPPNIAYTNSPFTLYADVAMTSQTPTNSGGTITSCSSSPALPAGLSLSNTCVLSGTPTAVQAATNYTVTATNSGGSRNATIRITIITTSPSLSYASSPYVYTKGSAITNEVPTNTGGTITSCASSPSLPAGLSLSSNCTISGTPTAVLSAANYTITGTNAAGNSSAVIQITVNDVIPSFSYASSSYVFTNGTAIPTLTPTQTGGAITSCSSSPNLPAGLSLSSTCVITGTPSIASSSTNYTISGTNSGGTATTLVQITVNDVAPAISYTGSPYNFTTGSAISTVTPNQAGGTPISCSSSPALPAGLTLSSTCVLNGTPTTPTAAADYTITATNSGGSSSDTINITVTSLAPILSYGTSTFTYTKGTAITNVVPNNTGGAINSCTSDNTLPTGLSLSSTCVLSGTPSAIASAANYVITATNANGSSSATLNITVNDVAPSIDYIPTTYSFTYTKGTAITTLTPNNSGGAITNCTVSPSLPAGLSLSTTTCAISGTPSGIQAATSYTLTASNTGGNSSATITITINDSPPTLNYGAGPFAYTVNAAMSALTPTVTGGAVTSCASSPGLPGGLSLSSGCIISGTPTVVTAAANYTITASNTGGSSSITISLQIKDVVPTLSYSGSPFVYTQGVALSGENPTNSGGAITSCSSSPTLPSGLNLSSSCVITGTPTTTSSATNYTITATNSGGSVNTSISITVNPGPPSLSASSGPYTFSNGSLITTITPTNSGGAVSSCSSSPGLPAGLALSSTCVISGTPTVASSATDYTITGTNAQGSSSFTVNITVNDRPPSISYSPSSTVQVLRTAMSNITPTNSGGTITSCSSNPTLPTGMNLSSACVISGTPTVLSAAANYTITGTNTGGSASAIINIEVKNLPLIVFHSLKALNGSTNGTAAGSNNIWITTVDGINQTALTQNSNASLDSKNSSFTADGTKVYSNSKRATNGSTNGTATGSYNIWNSLADGTSPSIFTSNTNTGLDSDDPPSISPDGTKIAFASKMAISGSANGTATGSYNIWIVNSDGTGLTHLTANTNSGLDSIQPTFGSTSSVVYFVSKTAQNGSDNGTATSSYNVWKVNSDGTSRTPLTAYTGSGSDCQDITISPDGTTLVYASLANTGGPTVRSYNIWKMTTSGASNTYFTNNSATGLDSRYPRYSPDGSEIVFSSKMNVGGSSTNAYNIWKMSSAGASQVALTTNTAVGTDSINPIFSPDNTKIAFASKMNIGASSSSSYNIWVMDSGGSNLTALTSNTNAGLDSFLGTGRSWYAP